MRRRTRNRRKNNRRRAAFLPAICAGRSNRPARTGFPTGSLRRSVRCFRRDRRAAKPRQHRRRTQQPTTQTPPLADTIRSLQPTRVALTPGIQGSQITRRVCSWGVRLHLNDVARSRCAARAAPSDWPRNGVAITRRREDSSPAVPQRNRTGSSRS